MLHEAQGLPTHVTQNAYSVEEYQFVKNSSQIHVSEVPDTANVISSHVLYKIKQLDDGSRLCKARISPHGNKDRERKDLKTDSASCPPLGIRIVLSTCLIFHWYLAKIDIKAAFLQSGAVDRDVYVKPPRECTQKAFYWLLHVATYGLVNTNSKWRWHSDNTFLDLGLKSVVHIPQLFYLRKDGNLQLIIAKVTDDIQDGGPENRRRLFVDQIAQRYQLGTVVHLPRTFKFYGLTIDQDNDYQITLSCEDKLQDLQPHIISRLRRKATNAELNPVELH